MRQLKKALLFMMLFPLLAMVSCSEEVVNPYVGEPTTEDDPQLEAILNHIEELFAQVEPSTRGSQRKVQSVEVKPSTRSEASDNTNLASAYLINYEDSQGYAYVTADTDNPIVMAFSPQGNLHFSDAGDNPALATWFEEADGFLAANSSTRSTIISPGIRTIYEITDSVSPMIHPFISTWHQDAPFNSYCPLVNGKSSKVGCVAVAAGMICSYFNYPQSFAGLNFSWTDLKNNKDKTHSAKVLHLIGEYAFDVVYGNEATSVGMWNFGSAFDAMGYQYIAYEKMAFSACLDQMLDFMKQGDKYYPRSPLLMVSSKVFGVSSHAYVVDGYIKRVSMAVNALGVVIGPRVEQPLLLHCLWGSSSSANGYYAYINSSYAISPNCVISTDDDTSKSTTYPETYTFHYANAAFVY